MSAGMKNDLISLGLHRFSDSLNRWLATCFLLEVLELSTLSA